jgi:hypothetical protein
LGGAALPVWDGKVETWRANSVLGSHQAANASPKRDVSRSWGHKKKEKREMMRSRAGSIEARWLQLQERNG